MSLLKACGSDEKLYSDDVFSSWVYTGNGSTQTINNGIDLAGKGGLVWTKCRNLAYDAVLEDTIRLAGNNKPYFLIPSSAASQSLSGGNIQTFTSTGYTVGSQYYSNESNATYVDWTFRKAPKFFDVVTWTGNGVAGRQIAHNLGIAPGMIIVKCTSAGYGWVVYHRSIGASGMISLHGSAAANTGTQWFAGVTPTDGVFSLGGDDSVNRSGETYVAYLFAHDTSTD
jgi:hypothetical protein